MPDVIRVVLIAVALVVIWLPRRRPQRRRRCLAILPVPAAAVAPPAGGNPARSWCVTLSTRGDTWVLYSSTRQDSGAAPTATVGLSAKVLSHGH